MDITISTNTTACSSSVAERAAKLTTYIRSLPDFAFIERQAAHAHMGATIAEGILQAGMRYHAQVKPRVRRVLAKDPAATTSSAFLQVLEQKTPEAVVKINGRKARYTLDLTRFLVSVGVETEVDLRTWLDDQANLQQLHDVPGVGDKTISYLRLLVGHPDAVAVDTRLRAFLARAGITTYGYDDTVAVVTAAAALLDVTPASLDVSIWCDADRHSR